MGWWNNDGGCLLGDGPLDDLEDCLSRFVLQYEREQNRKPTLNEIMASIKLVLGSVPDEYISSSQPIDLLEVSVKTRPRPKRQKPLPGSIFSVPLGNDTFAFGRLTPQSGIADFYRVKSRKRVVSARTLSKFPLFRLSTNIATRHLIDGSYLIFDRALAELEPFSLTNFRIGNKITCGRAMSDGFIDVTAETRVAAEHELATVNAFSISNKDMVAHLLLLELESAPSV